MQEIIWVFLIHTDRRIQWIYPHSPFHPTVPLITTEKNPLFISGVPPLFLHFSLSNWWGQNRVVLLTDIISPFKPWPNSILESLQLQYSPTHLSMWSSAVFPGIISKFQLLCEPALIVCYQLTCKKCVEETLKLQDQKLGSTCINKICLYRPNSDS